jgi:hypothetical protein
MAVEATVDGHLNGSNPAATVEGNEKPKGFRRLFVTKQAAPQRLDG